MFFLTPVLKAYLLVLLLLAQNKGKVLDRDSLFHRCWGRGYMPNSRALDQHISKLSQLIEQDHKHL